MDFTGFKLRRTKKYSFNHIKVHCITYNKLVYPYIENDVLILDYYRLNCFSKALMKSYTVKVYKNNTWEIDGVKQTRKPKIGELKAYVISNTELGYYLTKAFISNVVGEFINNKYSGTLVSLIKFLTRKKSKAYIPKHLQQKCKLLKMNITDYLYNNGDFIYKKYDYGLIITKDYKVYNFNFRSFELIIPKYIYLQIESGIYEKLNSLHLCINNKNINEILYFLENDLTNLINNVNDKQIMQIIKKLSLSKKRILNNHHIYWYSSFYNIKNLNAYRDEDFKILVQCHEHSFPNALAKYKNYRKYFDYYSKNSNSTLNSAYFYSCKDYFCMFIDNKNVISTNRFPKYPAPDKIEHLHDELIAYIRNLKDQEKIQRVKVLNGTYDLLKPQLKKLEYSNDKYSIIIPEQLEDLIKEGDVLHHCVGSYVDAVIDKRNKIYFLRKNTELTKPYFTIDVDYSNTVRQVHTYCNKNVSDVPEHMELVSFIKSWVEDKNLILSNLDNIRCAL